MENVYKGQKIESSIQNFLQIQTQTALNSYVENLAFNQIHNAAAVIIDVKTNQIIAYSGNATNSKSHSNQVDVINANRSTGSLLKPFLYASMLYSGELSSNELLPDIPTFISGYSPKNFFLDYEKENKEATYLPKEDDLVTMTYNLTDFENDTIYTNQEIGIFKYKVDKQKLFVGLRNSVKLLKEGETATFLFPSSLGYGYLGDKNKIGANIPLKATISILQIEKNKDSIQN